MMPLAKKRPNTLKVWAFFVLEIQVIYPLLNHNAMNFCLLNKCYMKLLKIR